MSFVHSTQRPIAVLQMSGSKHCSVFQQAVQKGSAIGHVGGSSGQPPSPRHGALPKPPAGNTGRPPEPPSAVLPAPPYGARPEKPELPPLLLPPRLPARPASTKLWSASKL